MVSVVFADQQKKLRLMLVAIRLVGHSYDALQNTPEPPQLWYQIAQRWGTLQGDKPISEMVDDIIRELSPHNGTPFYDKVSEALAQKYDYRDQIRKLNKLGFEHARDCVSAWGGRKSQARLGGLKPLNLRCETTDTVNTLLRFDRKKHRIKIHPGEAGELIRDCRLIEFGFFHEYLSHAFPTWVEDQYALSEGWLLALEIYWFEEKFPHGDNELLASVWTERLSEAGREDYHLARRLLNRCKGRTTCVKRFLLEWVADWHSQNHADCEDLVSNLLGVANKAGSKLYGSMSGKHQKTLDRLDEVLCRPCRNSSWKIDEMRDALAAEMERYDSNQKS